MPDTLYRSHKLEKSTSDGQVITSGSITTWEDEPVSPFDVGDIFRPVPDGPLLTVKKVNINDNVIGTVAGKTVRQWQISVEGDNSSEDTDSSTSQQKAGNVNSFSIEQSSDGSLVFSGDKEVSYSGKTPRPNFSVGDTFHHPVVGALTCSKISGSEDGSNNWVFTFEGSRRDAPPLPDEEVSVSYEINGSTVRTVAGEFIALKRSDAPITRKTITVYTDSASLVAPIGSAYQGGIAVSENISKENIKNNGISIQSYYRHVIEVEA